MKYKILRRIAKTLLCYLARLPLLDKVIENILENRNFTRRYHHEILSLRDKHKTSNTHQSIVFFAVERGGSTYAFDLLWKLVCEKGITPMNLEGYFWEGGKSEKDIFCPPDEWAKAIYKQKGYLYGSFVAFNEGIPFLERYKVILMLRDPRDVLVSRYFSAAYSHPLPIRNPNEAKRRLMLREKALQMTVDEYVLEDAGTLLNIYSRYCERLLNKSYVLFVKYEEMVNDFESWLDKIIGFAEFHPRSEVKDEIVRGANFKVAEENIYAHKRQVTPRDHRRKLKVETIDALNVKFRHILEKLSYREEVQYV